MTDRRDPGRKLLSEKKQAQRERDQARAALDAQAVVLRALQGDAIALFVRGRLLRLEDFHVFIGSEKVLHADGRVDFRQMELLISDLVRRRPELAAPTQIVA